MGDFVSESKSVGGARGSMMFLVEVKRAYAMICVTGFKRLRIIFDVLEIGQTLRRIHLCAAAIVGGLAC